MPTSQARNNTPSRWVGHLLSRGKTPPTANFRIQGSGVREQQLQLPPPALDLLPLQFSVALRGPPWTKGFDLRDINTNHDRGNRGAGAKRPAHARARPPRQRRRRFDRRPVRRAHRRTNSHAPRQPLTTTATAPGLHRRSIAKLPVARRLLRARRRRVARASPLPVGRHRRRASPSTPNPKAKPTPK